MSESEQDSLSLDEILKAAKAEHQSGNYYCKVPPENMKQRIPFRKLFSDLLRDLTDVDGC